MKTVLFTASTLSQSGYGVHARQVARYLLSKEPQAKINFEIVPWGSTSWILDKSRFNGLIGKIMERSVVPSSQYDVAIHLKLPNEFNPQLGRFNIGMTAAVETDKCNPEWVQACNRMNMMIVPSNHVKQTLENSGKLIVPTYVIPEAFPDAVLKEENKINIDFETSFNFLLFGQITGNNPENDRKNTFYTIKWLCESFSNDKDVGIVIKTNAAKNTKIDRKYCENLFTQVINDVRKTPFPKFYLLHGDMSEEEVIGLYKHPKIKALVNAGSGEGFNIPALEAAACGLPVIATNWSGHLDFMNQGKFIKLDYTLQEIHPSRVDNKIFMQGTKWAKVNEDDFKRKINKFKVSSSMPKEWATELSKKLIPTYNFNAISKQYDELLNNILL